MNNHGIETEHSDQWKSLLEKNNDNNGHITEGPMLRSVLICCYRSYELF